VNVEALLKEDQSAIVRVPEQSLEWAANTTRFEGLLSTHNRHS
jgi:hypothetical protein